MRSLVRATDPGRNVRRVGHAFGADPAVPAGNVNALDEVPNSSWFTNRIGLFPMSEDEVARGPRQGDEPTKPLTVFRTKSEGITPGFTVRDAVGRTYFIKFDPPGLRGASTGAGVVAGRLLHAIGYNVPSEEILHFERSDLVLAPDVPFTSEDGTKRAMTEADLDRLLGLVARGPGGDWLAIASLRLDGKPVGPFDYRGRRGDDPNDRVRHEHRRELRALRLFAAWLCHYDTKRENTLDMYVEEDGRGYVRHHLLDFASTLGMGATGPEPAYGWEYSFDPPAIAGRLFALGLREDAWRANERPPGLPQVGYFEAERFDPMEWKPLVPNPAFSNLTDRDGYWAAKILSSFTDADLRAAVEEGRFEDAGTAPYLAEMLARRRDRIVRECFDRVPPIDFFRVVGDEVLATDLAVARGLIPASATSWRIRSGWASADREIERWSEWSSLPTTSDGSLAVLLELDATDPSLPAAAFRAVQVEVDHGRGWRGPVSVYISPRTRQVVELSR